MWFDLTVVGGCCVTGVALDCLCVNSVAFFVCFCMCLFALFGFDWFV